MPHLELSDVTILLAQIAAIVLVSRTLGLVTRWLGQPLVIAEVVAGIVLGPSLLGWLWPEAMSALFPAASLPALKMLSQVGLVLFMFLVGLELDPRLLAGRAHSSVVISHTSIIFPFALGAGAAYWLRDGYSSPEVPFLSFVLFLGISMSVTAFPVLARILSERNLMTSRVGAITIACAAVDDVTAWCLLAFVVAVARAQGIAQAVWTTGFALGYVLVMLVLVRPFARRVGARVASREGLTPTVVAIILLMLIASSTVTELIGIHALFGAFMFGAILPKEGKLADTLIEKLETVAVVLFLPLFFAYSGLRTQIGLVTHPTEWLVALSLILVATVGKFGGSALAARLTGFRWREATAIGILMNTRGLMELIVLNIGLDLGVITPTVFTMLVIMALVTTFATTPILRWVYPDSELARDRAPLPATVEAGAAPPFGVMMCVSDQTVGPGLATLAAALAGPREDPARFFALHLWQPSDRPSVDQRRNVAESEVAPLAPLLGRARELMVDVRPLSFVSSEPAADICRTAEAVRAQLVLLGAHKPLLLEGTLGGTVRDVIRNAATPVGVLVDRGLRQVKRVLVAYLGGVEDRLALQLAKRVVAAPGTQLTLLHVVTPGAAVLPGKGRTQIDEVFPERDVEGSAVRVLVVEHASAPDAVLDEARRGYDLVILGMRARWGLERSLLSLRRRRVLAEAQVSILAVHPAASVAAEAAASQSVVPRLADS
jgi:Kef-type K+ transport system membrane component KefB/nucleotide-binding universal stress UspA family protein